MSKVSLVHLRAGLLFVAVVWASVAHADPENFLHSGFLFQRPQGWSWVWDEERSRKGNLMEVQGTNATDTAVVYFWKAKDNLGNAENRTKAWQGYFKDPAKVSTRSAVKTVGSFSVVFIEMAGTFPKSSQPYGLIGATIELETGVNLAIRMSGPKAVIEVSKDAFTEMILEALRTRQAE